MTAVMDEPGSVGHPDTPEGFRSVLANLDEPDRRPAARAMVASLVEVPEIDRQAWRDMLVTAVGLTKSDFAAIIRDTEKRAADDVEVLWSQGTDVAPAPRRPESAGGSRADVLARHGLIEVNGWTYPMPGPAADRAGRPGRPPAPFIRAVVTLSAVVEVYATPQSIIPPEFATPQYLRRLVKQMDTRYELSLTTPNGRSESLTIVHADLVDTSPEWPTRLQVAAISRRHAALMCDLIDALRALDGYEHRVHFDAPGWVAHPRNPTEQLLYVLPGAGSGAIGTNGLDPMVSVEYQGDYGTELSRHGLIEADPATAAADVRVLFGVLSVPAGGVGPALVGQLAFNPLSQFVFGTTPPVLISGGTGSNKTAYAQLLAAAYGEVYGPSRQPDVNLRELQGRKYSLEQLISGAGFVPLLCDDPLRRVDVVRTGPRFYNDLISPLGSALSTGKEFKRSTWSGGKRGSFSDPLWPRAAVIVPVEHVPAPAEHESDLARWVWVTLEPGQITWPWLNGFNTREACWSMRRAMFGYVSWLTTTYGYGLPAMLTTAVETATAALLDNAAGAHPGLYQLYARIIVGLDMLTAYAVEVGALEPGEADELAEANREALYATLRDQSARMGYGSAGAVRASDERATFWDVLRYAMRAGFIAPVTAEQSSTMMLTRPKENELPPGQSLFDVGWDANGNPKQRDAFTHARFVKLRGSGAPVTALQVPTASRGEFFEVLTRFAEKEVGKTLADPLTIKGLLERTSPGRFHPWAKFAESVKDHSRQKNVKVDQYDLTRVFPLDDDEPEPDAGTDAAGGPGPDDLCQGCNLGGPDQVIDGEPWHGGCRVALDDATALDRAAADRLPIEPAALEETTGDPVEVADVEPPAVEPVPVDAAAVLVPRRWIPVDRRPAAYVDVTTGHGVTDEGRAFSTRRSGPLSRRTDGRVSAAAILDAVPDTVAVVHLLGLPEMAHTVRTWFNTPVTGWSDAGHYLAKPDTAVGRWAHEGSGRRVSVYRVETWFGVTPTSPDVAREAMTVILDAVRTAGRGRGAQHAADLRIELFATPAQTGRDLWRHAVGERIADFAPLPDDVQRLIRSTSGQGRIELFSAGDTRSELPGLVEQDLTFGYAGLVKEIGSGPVLMLTGEATRELWSTNQYARGRAHVRVTVPDGWSHIGLLGVKAAEISDGWTYPHTPGETFDTWADFAEIHLAADRGWSVEFIEGMQLTGRARPLDTWAKRLVDARDRMAQRVRRQEVTPEVGALARSGLRALVLHGIGAFQGSPIAQTRIGAPDAVPGDARSVRRLDDGRYEWTEVHAPTGIPAECSHPEFSAAVWARCRRRLLIGPHGNEGEGALALDRTELVAARTDALYLTSDPGWSSDQVGRFRRKSAAPGPVVTPRTWGQFDALRHQVMGGE